VVQLAPNAQENDFKIPQTASKTPKKLSIVTQKCHQNAPKMPVKNFHDSQTPQHLKREILTSDVNEKNGQYF
jgi:hypothetical protein